MRASSPRRGAVASRATSSDGRARLVGLPPASRPQRRHAQPRGRCPGGLVAAKICGWVPGVRTIATGDRGYGRSTRDREAIARTLVGLGRNPSVYATIVWGGDKTRDYPETRAAHAGRGDREVGEGDRVPRPRRPRRCPRRLRCLRLRRVGRRDALSKSRGVSRRRPSPHPRRPRDRRICRVGSWNEIRTAISAPSRSITPRSSWP